MKSQEDLEVNEIRLIMSRKAVSMAISFLSGKMVDVQENREMVLSALKEVLEAIPSEVVRKFNAMEMVCMTASDYLAPCSCCRVQRCHSNCRCSNSGSLKKYLDQYES